MTVDAEKLLAFRVPNATQRLSPIDVAFYALSVGLGRDPCDERQLPFVDPLSGPKVLPSMVLVMAHPGFWLSDPATGVDPTSVLHVAQSFEILGPLPFAGTIVSTTNIDRLVDKGVGKPALLFTTTELVDERGAGFATLSRTTYIRNGGGFGSKPDQGEAAPPWVPGGPADYFEDLPTGREQALLYRLNGDLNPLHSDPATARKAGFDGPILHGLCTMGVITHALLRSLGSYDSAAIRSMSLRFSAPVFPGDTIRTEIWRDGHFRATVPSRGVVVADQGRCTLFNGQDIL